MTLDVDEVLTVAFASFYDAGDDGGFKIGCCKSKFLCWTDGCSTYELKALIMDL